MAENTQNQDATEQTAAAGESPKPEQAKVDQISGQKAMELQQLVSEQVVAADPSTPMTMTELLADENGAFAKKAQELGVTEAWDKFTSEQQQIGQMREEYLKVEESRSADANRVANVTPSLEQEASKLRKSSGISGIIGAVVGGAGAAFAAAKKTGSTPMRAVIAAAGAVFGGAVAAIFSAKRGVQKSMDKVQQEMGDLGNMQPDPELAQKAASLQEQLGQAQQESMEGIVDAMVGRMTERELVAEQAKAHAAEQGAALKAEQAAQQNAPQQQPQQHTAAPQQEEPAVQPPSPEQVAQSMQQEAQPASSLEDKLAAAAEKAAAPEGGKAEAIMRQRQEQQAAGPQR